MTSAVSNCFSPEDLPERQVGYAVIADGEFLAGKGPGDWQAEWLVIGYETGCGDPVFASQTHPHPVFTAVHGQGSWDPTLIAPSLEMFRNCLEVFRRFAQGRSDPAELETNPPSEQEQEQAQFLRDIRQFTADDAEAWSFWAIQIEIDPEGCEN